MIQALHTSALGMKSQQNNIDVIANNIANSETVGYKKDKVSFKDALYVAMIDPNDANSTENLQKGTGSIVSAISKIYNEPIVAETGNVLDVAMTNPKSFFTIQKADGTTCYTRDGSFKVSSENGDAYLVTGNGDYVLDDNEQKISLDGDINKIKIDSDGNIADDSGTYITKLKTVSFTNVGGLESLGSNSFEITTASGNEYTVDNPGVKQKFVEKSNVDMAEEITNLIKAQRAYQLSSRTLTVSDQMEEIANNIRRG